MTRRDRPTRTDDRAPTPRPDGFTLLELLLALSISVALLTAGALLFVSGLKNAVVSQGNASANTVARDALAYMDRDIKQGSQVLASATVSGVTYTTNGSVIVLQQPAWNNATSSTIDGVSDTVIYAFYTTITDGSGTHKTWNIRRIVSPGAGSSRIVEARWLFPWDVNRDAGNPARYRSDPRVEITPGFTSIFTCYKQDPAHPGQVVALSAGDSYNLAALVQTNLTVQKEYDATTLRADVETRSRLRNWSPPS